MAKKRDLEVESLKTSKGANVPTVKGLQAIIDGIYDDISPLEQSIAALHEGFQSVSGQVEDLSKRLGAIQQFLSDFVLMIGKIDTALSELNHNVRTIAESSKGIEASSLDIFEVRDLLTDLLAQSKFSDLLEEAQSISRPDTPKKVQLNDQEET
jgi:methyl-accepting chemotaxis protein